MVSSVVVGGGFAGLNAALAAVRVGGEKVFVSLISREPWLTIRPRLYESHPEKLRADLLTPLSAVGANFIGGDAVDLGEGCVRLATGEPVAFDRLVVATGSVMKRPAIRGAERCQCIDDWPAAMAFDARLAAISAAHAPRVVVIGAGFTGLELALELRNRLAVHAGSDKAERAHILLVDLASHIGPELGDAPRPVIERALADARVETRLGVQVSSIAEGRVSLADGEQIDCDAIVLCTGLHAAPFVASVEGRKDRFGRLIVDAHLRAPEARGVFAAGDACCAIPERGRQTLMSCQHALTLGKYAGENAARDLLGMRLLEYLQPRYVTCLDLGRSGAVFSEGWERVPVLTGDRAKAIKTDINTRRIYPPTGNRDEVLAASQIE